MAAASRVTGREGTVTSREYRAGDQAVRVHLHQLVHDGDGRTWIVTGLSEGSVLVAYPREDGEWWTRDVAESWFVREYEPVVAGGVPVWGW